VAYWDRQGLVLRNYRTGKPVGATPLVFDVLDRLGEWVDEAALVAAFPAYPRRAVRRLIDALVAAGLVERGPGRPTDVRADDGWDDWSPAAAFFHFATRDTPFAPPSVTTPLLRAKAAVAAPPPPLKASSATRAIALPPFRSRGALTRTLQARRTWRRFRAGPIALGEVSRLLGLTWGVQHWLEIPPFGRLALKTSPSGGAQHSVEVYLLARRVDGVAPGIYHYDPDAHALQRVKRGLAARDLEAYLPHQAFYRDAAACFVMTAVFARVQWRYPFARAYRTVLSEVGHHCQTLLLLATEMGLAPFCTMALADSRIERDLGIDGRTESVLYLAGVGQRPSGEAWAPRPAGERTPERFRPRWATPDRRDTRTI
jgi:SagB-type dehydrogenase family enzyme